LCLQKDGKPKKHATTQRRKTQARTGHKDTRRRAALVRRASRTCRARFTEARVGDLGGAAGSCGGGGEGGDGGVAAVRGLGATGVVGTITVNY
jgi:hypothetical protein